jgi:hypothetical protein
MLDLSKRNTLMISGGLADCMFGVAWSDTVRGAPAGEVHLITAAPVAAASSVVAAASGVVASGSNVVLTSIGFHNAIIGADYIAPSDSRPLPRDGVSFSRIWSSPPDS